MPESLRASRAVFDRGEAEARVGGNLALLREVAALFLEDAPRWLRVIQTALYVRDPEALWRSAHALQGSAASLSARAAQETARRLAAQARAGDLAGAAELLPPLETALDRLLPVLAEVAETRPVVADGFIPPDRPTPPPWRRPPLPEFPS
jgi:HPt (histidine-containing phosphotransfer) domain-containing protein